MNALSPTVNRAERSTESQREGGRNGERKRGSEEERERRRDGETEREKGRMAALRSRETNDLPNFFIPIGAVRALAFSDSDLPPKLRIDEVDCERFYTLR